MSRILIFILRAYQAFLSPLMPGGCKFYPSCSHYAVEAVERHGALRGAWLAALRVLRCRPFARGGYDPVPSAAAVRPPVQHEAEERSLKAAPLERAR